MPSAAATPPPFEPLAAVVRAILVRKSGMTLAADDPRHDNVEALELMHDVLARLWERLAEGGAEGVGDLGAYAAGVTHNAWADHLRRKYPQRTRLKNRLRYFLEHQRSYALWPGDDGELLAGRHGWPLRGLAAAPRERIAALRDRRERLPRGARPRRGFDQLEAADWDAMVGALLDHFERPLPLDDLVALLALLLDLREDRTLSLDAEADDAASPGLQLADAAARQPEQLAETRSLLRQLWGAVLTLKPDHRRAYLLNLPGPGKSRADIEVFVIHAVASIAEIGAAIDLEPRQLRQALAELAPSEAERAEAAAAGDAETLFCLLWPRLPLADALIGRLLGLEPQQVINRRMLALRELARLLHAGGGGAR